jgi:peptide-methionine (S)-S-oxide reductase
MRRGGNLSVDGASNAIQEEVSTMKAPYIGRALSFMVMLGLVIWWGGRILSGQPAEPKGRFPAPAVDASLSAKAGTETAVFSGGCFWGVQGVFEHVKGVRKATSGYAGGTVENPYYELVSSGSTGHAESVRVIFDPSQVSYGNLLMIFFSVAHDPTQKDRQGPDVGTQYRSAVFYTSDEQKKIAESYIAQINKAKVYNSAIATQVVAYSAFYPAEDYHQDYLAKHPDDPYIAYNDLPKIKRLKQTYPDLYR